MKVSIIGEYAWHWYQEACAAALESLGCSVHRFGWSGRFKKSASEMAIPVYKSKIHALQYYYVFGPLIRRLNSEIVAAIAREQPDVVWFYNVQLVDASTIRRIRRVAPQAILCQYANDNPFTQSKRGFAWRHFRDSIRHVDVNLAYRDSDIQKFAAHGAKTIHLLRAYFIPEDDRPVSPIEIQPRFRSDVVFAGHYENDGRVAALEAICRAGYKLNLFGGGWAAAWPKLSDSSPLRQFFPVQPVTANHYREAICGAKVALCFLSRLNQDTYTRRCFQIPAMKVPLLSERTDDLCRLFREDEEAVLFSDHDEMLAKLKWLLQNEGTRSRIAEAGYARVYGDGHDVRSRMKEWLDIVAKAMQR